MRYVAEQPPSTVDSELAEYLLRQFYAIASATDTEFVAPRLASLPERPIEGGIVYLYTHEDETKIGMYACIAITNDGDPEWKQVQTL
jgi:hypothetical protein